MKNMEELKWFHSIDLRDGGITPGVAMIDHFREITNNVFDPMPVAGKTVLDIGAYDGFHSFEAEQGGASRVLATDYHCWSGGCGATKEPFDYAHKALNSKVEDQVLDLHELRIDTVGQFDVVLFLGVLYHLKDPMIQLERLLPLAKEVFVIETITGLNNIETPAFQYFTGCSLNNDYSNYFGPNLLALQGMLYDLGYTNITMKIVGYPFGFGAPYQVSHAVVHVWK